MEADTFYPKCDSLTKMNDFTGRELSINQVIKYIGEIPKGVNTVYQSNDSLTQVDPKGKNTFYQPCDSLTKVISKKRVNIFYQY